MRAAVSLESYLSHSLFGQETAIKEYASVIERAAFGPGRSARTKAFILLLGPTGTGKTELAKLTARYLFGEQAGTRLERFDLGEYQHPDAVQRLLGSGGHRALLGEAIDRLNQQGGGLLLLDEIEKAHPDLLTLLLSFDDARSTMADGSTKDLSACYVILTSNIGAAEASQMVASGASAVRRKVLREAETILRRETLARFSAVIVMDPLAYEAQVRIAAALLEKELALQSAHLRRCIAVDDSDVLGFLVGRGYTPDLGARQMRRTVESFVGEALRGVRPRTAPPSTFSIGDLLSEALLLGLGQDVLVAYPARGAPPVQASDTYPMSADTNTPREQSLIHIEVLDLGPLYEQAVEHYLSLDPARRAWSEDRKRRLVIRTECRWGRVETAPGACFLVNEKGEGPREPLSDVVSAQIALYAELVAEGNDPGHFEAQPFCRVSIDANAAKSFRSLGLVALEDFIRTKLPEMEEVYREWLGLLRSSREKARSARQRKMS